MRTWTKGANKLRDSGLDYSSQELLKLSADYLRFALKDCGAERLPQLRAARDWLRQENKQPAKLKIVEQRIHALAGKN